MKAALEKHPWITNQWQARFQDVPISDYGIVLFMQAARWPDDIRSNDKQHHRALWHYINWPFKPAGQPASVQISGPDRVNVLTTWPRMERVVATKTDPKRKAIAPAYLYHLMGNIHQPLHNERPLEKRFATNEDFVTQRRHIIAD